MRHHCELERDYTNKAIVSVLSQATSRHCCCQRRNQRMEFIPLEHWNDGFLMIWLFDSCDRTSHIQIICVTYRLREMHYGTPVLSLHVATTPDALERLERRRSRRRGAGAFTGTLIAQTCERKGSCMSSRMKPHGPGTLRQERMEF